MHEVLVMNTLQDYEPVADLLPCCSNSFQCRKRVFAKQMTEEVEIELTNGDLILGHPGDYLVQELNNKLSIYNEKVFNQLYKFINL